MSDMVVVYESRRPFWVEEILDAMREEGLHPELGDDAGGAYYRKDNKNPGVVGMPQGRMKVCIVVPREEEPAARLFLQKRGEQSDSYVAELTSGLRRPLVLSILATAAAFITMAYLVGEPGACLAMALMTVLPASFILTANAHLLPRIMGQTGIAAVTAAAVITGMHRLSKGQIWIGCLLLAVPIIAVAYVFFRTHEFALSRKKDDSWD